MDVFEEFRHRRLALRFEPSDIELAKRVQCVIDDRYGKSIRFFVSGTIANFLRWNKDGTYFIAIASDTRSLGFMNTVEECGRKGYAVMSAGEFLDCCLDDPGVSALADAFDDVYPLGSLEPEKE